MGQWNSSCSSSAEKAIASGDRIIRVNGKKGSLLAECGKNELLHLVLIRAAGGAGLNDQQWSVSFSEELMPRESSPEEVRHRRAQGAEESSHAKPSHQTNPWQ